MEDLPQHSGVGVNEYVMAIMSRPDTIKCYNETKGSPVFKLYHTLTTKRFFSNRDVMSQTTITEKQCKELYAEQKRYKARGAKNTSGSTGSKE